MKTWFVEGPLIGFLKQAEAGVPVKDLCRKHGVSDASCYTCPAQYDGVTVPEANRHREFERDCRTCRYSIGRPDGVHLWRQQHRLVVVFPCGWWEREAGSSDKKARARRAFCDR